VDQSAIEELVARTVLGALYAGSVFRRLGAAAQRWASSSDSATDAGVLFLRRAFHRIG